MPTHDLKSGNMGYDTNILKIHPKSNSRESRFHPSTRLIQSSDDDSNCENLHCPLCLSKINLFQSKVAQSKIKRLLDMRNKPMEDL